MREFFIKKWLLVISFVLIAFVWGMIAKSESYSEPQEALLSKDSDLVLIPSYQLKDKALFFFIKKTNHIGAAYVEKGLFGWNAQMLTWSQMNMERGYEKLDDIKGHGDSLIYGLIRNGDERLVKIGESYATILDLAVILPPSEVENYRLKGLFIWYFEGHTSPNEEEITLINKITQEELDAYF
ncbi:aspartyl-tRNA synthetase [Lysinibacillus fusiformis]|uniref:aspartyl-tRNA synthetase n=1 Tax=Lysinibacillus fusiformis TaxID=28031 RepID=UPI00215AF4B0|nr:aspartyl-tRNA synthetase [Lysinibacillus fusiformis]MCR8853620.1 aspartyl-tRNA synthetase [Lysinibacillus fusiformis]WKT79548.1 aspartyl-tRNA synthetase [Lysinibacillus fusiformis]